MTENRPDARLRTPGFVLGCALPFSERRLWSRNRIKGSDSEQQLAKSLGKTSEVMGAKSVVAPIASQTVFFRCASGELEGPR